jgi:hypothetical protein
LKSELETEVSRLAALVTADSTDWTDQRLSGMPCREESEGGVRGVTKAVMPRAMKAIARRDPRSIVAIPMLQM